MADDITLHELVDTLAGDHGPDLRGYKQSTLQRRIRKRMFELGIGTFRQYLEKVSQDRAEVPLLLNTVLINVTEFFRDAPAWDYLRAEVLPRLLKDLRPGDPFRAWSAGCASGEEAYSLAILVAEQLGSSLPEYDVKIYATDIDDEALNTARRGEYLAEKLRRVKPEWRDKYFQGKARLRVNRDIRRLVIFGRSNVVSDAPISHCNLVMCRNVLIYFDTKTQKNVLSRLHYALEPGGILFLGKAESKLTDSPQFRSLNGRWRIFQRVRGVNERTRSEEVFPSEAPMTTSDGKLQDELNRLKQYHDRLLDTLKSGVIALDEKDVILSHNEAALLIWNIHNQRLLGKRLQNTELVLRCPEIVGHLETSRNTKEAVSFQCSVRVDGEERTLKVAMRPVMSDTAERTGTLLNCEDVTDHEKLQSTVEQLEATSEELQSANEELETTNEELQSTNEELETTNEELQSTNEELETTNEELQSLNEELENMNEELEQRTQDLNTLNSHYAETLRNMPWPVMLVDADQTIQLWNASAQRIIGVGANAVVGVSVEQLPLESKLRRAIVRRSKATLERRRGMVMRNQVLTNDHNLGTYDIHFSPVERGNSGPDGVLVMFGPVNARAGRLSGDGASRGKTATSGSGPKTNSKNSGSGNRRRLVGAKATKRRR
jgi:two-component system, chemotaxis family, CheB/CheR fusion protein